MRYTIKHLVNTDVDTFWDKIFFDEEYNRALFVDHLGFTSYDKISFDKSDDGSVRRTLRCTPQVDLPAAAKKVFGNTTTYVEEGRLDPKARKWIFTVTPTVGADRIKTSGELWMEPRGDNACERFALLDNTVKVFGVGKIIETFIEKQTRQTYEEAARFTNTWIADKGL